MLLVQRTDLRLFDLRPSQEIMSGRCHTRMLCIRDGSASCHDDYLVAMHGGLNRTTLAILNFLYVAHVSIETLWMCEKFVIC